MREITTNGDICLTDDNNHTYKVADISYTEREDESFVYKFRPNYSVIELLGTKDFQGIPGLALDMKKECYVRENLVPVFISERSPGPHREDLQKLLQDCNMDYLNRLEWLIRTDTTYSGDKLYVQRPEDKSIMIDSLNNLGNTKNVICRKILEVICYGGTIETPTLVIDDSNRKQFFEVLLTLFKTKG